MRTVEIVVQITMVNVYIVRWKILKLLIMDQIVLSDIQVKIILLFLRSFLILILLVILRGQFLMAANLDFSWQGKCKSHLEKKLHSSNQHRAIGLLWTKLEWRKCCRRWMYLWWWLLQRQASGKHHFHNQINDYKRYSFYGCIIFWNRAQIWLFFYREKKI